MRGIAMRKLVVMSAVAAFGLILLQTGCSTFRHSFAANSGWVAGVRAVDGVTSLAVKGLSGTDRGKTTLYMAPDAPAVLAAAKRVAVVVKKPDNVQYWAGTGGLLDVLEAGTGGQFLDLEYAVVGSKAKKDLVVTCAPSTAMTYKGEYTTVGASGVAYRESISSASLEIQDAKTGEIILTAIVSYKKPKGPNDVAADFGKILRNAKAGAK
jgi:hypothetical protein